MNFGFGHLPACRQWPLSGYAETDRLSVRFRRFRPAPPGPLRRHDGGLQSARTGHSKPPPIFTNMTLHRSLVACLTALTFALMGSSPAMAQGPAIPVFSQAELSATPSAVKNFLAHVDEGNYSEAWPMVSKYVRASTGSSVWTTGLRGLRSAAGPLKARRAVTAGPIPTDDKMPAGGRYFAIFYKSSFANFDAEEKVILSQESGDWKVVGYFLSKCFGTKC